MNRWMGWMAAGVALVLAACTVPDLSALGPFSCEDSSACAAGYTCAAGRCVRPGEEPEGPGPGGLDDGGTLPEETDDGGTQPGGGEDGGTQPADTTPPTLELSVPSPPVRGPDGKTTYTEVGSDGKGLPAAWLRDQQVAVDLQTDTPLALSFSVKGGDGVALPLDVVRFTEGCQAPQCARVLVPMWAPRLDAMRGTFSFTATARDEAGNTTSRTGTLPVTRWKWAYTAYDAARADDSIDGTPGLGEKGTVYVSTYYTSLMALAPDGRALWTSPLSGEGTPVVGKQDDGREVVFVRGYWNDGSGEGHMLHVYDVASRTLEATCPSPLVDKLWFDSYALTSLGKSVSGAMTVARGATQASILYLRGGSSSSGGACQSSPTDYWPSERGNTVASGGALYYPQGDGLANSIQFGSTTPRTGWPVDSKTDEGINGLAVFSNYLVMGEGVDESGSVGGISRTDLDAGKDVSLRYSGGAIAAPVVGNGGWAFGVDRRSGRRLVRHSLVTSAPTVTSADFGFNYSLAPTLGQGGLLYAMRSGELGVWLAADLTSRWKWTPAGYPTGAKVQAPTLDCTRDDQGNPIPGRPGVLYAPIHNKVYAIVVDSAGLDADAPWPKFQHDGRNSGNPEVPVVRCP